MIADVGGSDSYAHALSAAKASQFGLYIVDHTLPDGRGFDLYKEIRKFDPKTPIIFCEGHTDDEHQKEPLSSGAQAFLPKPFASVDLLELIRSVQN
jgi:DNA-binding response OmpR family regulator